MKAAAIVTALAILCSLAVEARSEIATSTGNGRIDVYTDAGAPIWHAQVVDFGGIVAIDVVTDGVLYMQDHSKDVWLLRPFQDQGERLTTFDSIPFSFPVFARDIEKRANGEIVICASAGGLLAVAPPGTLRTITKEIMCWEFAGVDVTSGIENDFSAFYRVNLATGDYNFIAYGSARGISGEPGGATVVYADDDAARLARLNLTSGTTTTVESGSFRDVDVRADGAIFAISDTTLYAVGEGTKTPLASTGSLPTTFRRVSVGDIDLPEPASVGGAALLALALLRSRHLAPRTSASGSSP